MEIWLAVIVIVFILLVGLLEPLAEILEVLVDVRDDLKNRNDRGLLRKPSSKHVV